MAQSTVFSQLIKLIPRTKFQEFVARHDGDARVRSLDCWTWFGALLFGQMQNFHRREPPNFTDGSHLIS